MSRLIDADKILYFKGKDIVGEDAYMTQKEVIDEMPTIDAEPIRHGHWEKSKDDNDRWRCSHCGNVYIGFNGINSTFAEICYYCPDCGAKMDEVEENE